MQNSCVLILGDRAKCQTRHLGEWLRRRLVALLEMAEEIVGVTEFVVLIVEEVGPCCM